MLVNECVGVPVSEWASEWTSERLSELMSEWVRVSEWVSESWGIVEIGHVINAKSLLGTLVTSQVDWVEVSLALNYVSTDSSL